MWQRPRWKTQVQKTVVGIDWIYPNGGPRGLTVPEIGDRWNWMSPTGSINVYRKKQRQLGTVSGGVHVPAMIRQNAHGCWCLGTESGSEGAWGSWVGEQTTSECAATTSINTLSVCSCVRCCCQWTGKSTTINPANNQHTMHCMAFIDFALVEGSVRLRMSVQVWFLE